MVKFTKAKKDKKPPPVESAAIEDYLLISFSGHKRQQLKGPASHLPARGIGLEIPVWLKEFWSWSLLTKSRSYRFQLGRGA